MGGTAAVVIAGALAASDAEDQEDDIYAQRPKPADAPPIPQFESVAAQAAQADARERQRRQARAAGGRSSTILTGPLGLTAPPENAVSRTILGG